jgi:signal transduction histidine kinase
MKNPSIVKRIKNLSSSQKDLILIFFLAIIVFIVSNIFNLFDLILAFISQHDSWQLDDMIVISIFLVFALGVFSYRRSVELKKEIYEKAAAERALLNANKKINLLNSVTRHDILNQIMGLQIYFEFLKEEISNPAILEYIKKGSTAITVIQNQIEFTKEYQDIGAQAPKWQDARTLVESAAKDAPLGPVVVKNDIPAGTKVFADPLVVKVFYNLMDNAVRYGGKITTIRFTVQETGGDPIIVCEDDGNGVPAEKKEKIFKRGFGENTGLGLTLSREILSITSIDIHETGEPGKGARFEMTVPKGNYRMK